MFDYISFWYLKNDIYEKYKQIIVLYFGLYCKYYTDKIYIQIFSFKMAEIKTPIRSNSLERYGFLQDRKRRACDVHSPYDDSSLSVNDVFQTILDRLDNQDK